MKRFDFGTNWYRFISLVDEQRIKVAEQSLKNMLDRDSFKGLRFLDIGCGSGLFSLAARNLGAVVHSFDYDPRCVECAKILKNRYRPDDDKWQIEQGDVLDKTYLKGLGHFDVVYAWGVLHHTGNMWQALSNVAFLVKGGGQLYIAIYNDQGWLSKYWAWIKRIYNSNIIGQFLIIATHVPYLLTRHAIKKIIFPYWKPRRGMDVWRDIFDWLGGYPFEVARPESILHFYRKYGFILERMSTVGGKGGCNEFVFRAPLKQKD